MQRFTRNAPRLRARSAAFPAVISKAAVLRMTISSSAGPAEPASNAFSLAAFSSTSPARDHLERGPFEPRILGRDLELLDLAARQADRPRFGVQRDLVEPGAVDDQRLLDSRSRQGSGRSGAASSGPRLRAVGPAAAPG